MRKPVVDYREFRLSKINTPPFSHLKLLLGWIGYFALYVLTESLIPQQNCYVVHSPLDDIIPFCEVFIIPYVGWYFIIIASLVYFALYNIDGFKKLQILIIFTQIAAMAAYILFPNRQDLRPEVFPRDNFLTDCVGLLYSVDTNTNVCPSLHVGYSFMMASVWLKEKDASRITKSLVVISLFLVCLSTMFIKQHSAVDVFAAIAMCIPAELIVYRKWYKERLFRHRQA